MTGCDIIISDSGSPKFLEAANLKLEEDPGAISVK